MMATLRLLLTHRAARAGLLLVGLFVAMALCGPLIFDDPAAYVGVPHAPPSSDHLFGTTGQGQDVLAQTIAGARATVLLALLTGLMVVAIGAGIGTIAGYFGGRVDAAISLLINVFLVIPGLPLAIIVAAFVASGPISLAIVLILTGWAWNARVVRAQVLALRHRDFVAAAIVSGEGHFTVMWRDIVPNMASLLTAQMIGATIYALGALVGLEFLGLGDMSVVSWGTNLYWAANDGALLTGSWWAFVPTGVCIALVGFGLALVNFGVDEVTNRRLTAERHWRRFLRRRGHRARTHDTPVVRDAA